jgi:tetrahydromethanopterin S-methyltransferase subunit F
MDVQMALAEARYCNAKNAARLFAVGFVCALVFVGLLANLYVG